RGKVHDSTKRPPLHDAGEPSRSRVEQRLAGAERQRVGAVAGQLVRVMEVEKLLVERAVSRIAIGLTRIAVRVADRSAPGVGRRFGEALRQPLRELEFQRMIS